MIRIFARIEEKDDYASNENRDEINCVKKRLDLDVGIKNTCCAPSVK